MTHRRLLITGSLAAALVLIAGCVRFTGQTPPRNPGGAPALAATAEATSLPTTPLPTATPEASRTPAPTLDFVSMLVTQAYQNVTLTPHITESSVLTTTASSANVNADFAPLPTSTIIIDPVPVSVILSEPIQIANAVNTADCKIRNVGNCTPTIKAGETLFFTWTFGVKGEGKFQWGQAAVVVTRNGETFQWTQAGNGLVRPPNTDKGESWTLNVGQSAKFAAGLDNAQPGAYTARLMMCLLSMNECNAGNGWQTVGGEVINFVIVSEN